MDSETKMGMEDMGMEGADAGTFYLPEDFPNASSLKVGDKISLTVVALDDKSGEVEVAPEGKGTDWKSDLRTSMSEQPTED